MLSQPRFNLYFLSPFFYIPLHIYYRETRNPFIFLIGGTASFFFTIHWITHAITYYGGFPYIFSLLPLLLLSFVLGSFFLLFAYLRESIRRILTIPYSVLDPIVWVSTEYVKTFLFTGFPWALVGYSVWQKETLIQIADIGGVYMISFVIISISGFICDLYEYIKSKLWFQTIFSFFFCMLFLSFTVLYGVYRKEQINSIIQSQGSEIPVVVVQPSIPQDEKWTWEFKEKYLQVNIDLTFSAIDFPYQTVLAVWPETGLTFYLEREPDLANKVLELARKNFYIVAGGLGVSEKKGKQKFYNRAFLITQNRIYKYDKTHLVMFGEYIPLRNFLEKIPFIKSIIEDVEKVAGDFTPGEEVFPIGDDKIKVGVPICFESIFPEISRKFVRDGAKLIAVITNDAWFGYSSGPFQHFSVSAIRAVETRRFVVRSANTGISGAFSPTGKILKQTSLLQRTSFLVKVKLLDIKTFYVKYGDLFSGLCVALSSALYIFSYVLGIRNRNKLR